MRVGERYLQQRLQAQRETNASSGCSILASRGSRHEGRPTHGEGCSRFAAETAKEAPDVLRKSLQADMFESSYFVFVLKFSYLECSEVKDLL